MRNFKNRSDEVEIMDDLKSQGAEVEQTLKELDIINNRLGGNKISLNALSELVHGRKSEVLRIADLGCGGGDILKLFAEWALRKDYHFELTGIDANRFIVDYARQALKGIRNVTFKTENILSREFIRQKFDIIHCCLFLHHFTNDELIHLLENFKKQASLGIIINDLHRHWLAYYSIKFLTFLFSKSPMVKFDGPLSVARAFRRKELIELLEQAGIRNYQIKWRWAFRWEVMIRTG
ncbi:MAG: methyltransferase domain-containing protein [Bacteroidetes bacterium]|nr:methyltransferase domain-containing protein [Bacteroidota bacterium]MDA1119704.1 methyltransferase domain-containing protein [Bacteroidota bacterium]